MNIEFLYAMKTFRFYIGIFFIVVSLTAFGQSGSQPNTSKNNNIIDVINGHNEAIKANPGVNKEGEDGIEELYQRWLHFAGPRVKPDGTPYPPDILYKEWLKFNQTQLQPSYKTGGAAVWQYSGPFTTPANNGGNGRINCIRFQPGNPKIIWAGVPSGGLWKSIDSGATWSTNTDNLPNLGVTDIAINPRNPDTMFMATGDGYGYPVGANFFGGTYSTGIMRSIDGGYAWDTTGMTWSLTGANQICRLLINTANPNIILATASNGMWRSANGGNSWALVVKGNFKDIISNPLNPSEMFASSLNPSPFYKSLDTGKTWIALTTGFGSSAASFAMTPADTSIVYALVQGSLVSTSGTESYAGYVYKSSNSGVSWVFQGAVVATTFYGWYNLAINISPRDTNTVYVGGIDLAKSTNGGLTFSQITTDNGNPGNNYDHSDHRNIVFYPGSADTIYDGNDGGIFRSYDDGVNWTQISNGIQALEIYRIGSSATIPGLYYTGAQDNGINQADNGTWDFVRQGDGMTCIVDFDDPNTVYAATQYGYLVKSTDGGQSWSFSIEPEAGQWTAPIVMDPQNSSTLYYGGDQNIYKTINGGNTWSNISNGTNDGVPYNRIAISPANDNYVYISQINDDYPSTIDLHLSKDGGNTWTRLFGLPGGNQYVSGIAVERSSPDTVYISLSGYNAGIKVFKSVNGGTSWTNISTNLPNVPADCIVSEGSTLHGVYVGTDIGVFYLCDTSTNGNWTYYNNGLPNVIVDDMEIIPLTNKIRAATYGRGVWDGTLAGTLTSIETTNALNKEIHISPNPSTGIFNVSLPEYNGAAPAIYISDMYGGVIKQFSPAEISSNSRIALDLSDYASGIYTVTFIYANGIAVKKVDMLK